MLKLQEAIEEEKEEEARGGKKTRQARSISRHVNSPLKKRLKAASTYLSSSSFFSLFFCLPRRFPCSPSYLLVAAGPRLLPLLSSRAYGIIINDNSISGTRLGLG